MYQSDGCCSKNDGFCIKNGGLCITMMDSVVNMMDVVLQMTTLVDPGLQGLCLARTEFTDPRMRLNALPSTKRTVAFQPQVFKRFSQSQYRSPPLPELGRTPGHIAGIASQGDGPRIFPSSAEPIAEKVASRRLATVSIRC